MKRCDEFERDWWLWEEKTGLKAEPITDDLAAELEAAGRSVQELIMLDAQHSRYVRSQDRCVKVWDMLDDLFAWGLLP